MGDKMSKSAAAVANRPKIVIERTYPAQRGELWDSSFVTGIELFVDGGVAQI